MGRFYTWRRCRKADGTSRAYQPGCDTPSGTDRISSYYERSRGQTYICDNCHDPQQPLEYRIPNRDEKAFLRWRIPQQRNHEPVQFTGVQRPYLQSPEIGYPLQDQKWWHPISVRRSLSFAVKNIPSPNSHGSPDRSLMRFFTVIYPGGPVMPSGCRNTPVSWS